MGLPHQRRHIEAWHQERRRIEAGKRDDLRAARRDYIKLCDTLGKEVRKPEFLGFRSDQLDAERRLS